MTITDFLLARIAEDEEALKRGYDVRATFAALSRHTLNERVPGFLWRTPEAVAAYMREISEQATALDAADRERRKAECEAKRRLIELAATCDVPSIELALAEVYVDHPDYDEAWRV